MLDDPPARPALWVAPFQEGQRRSPLRLCGRKDDSDENLFDGDLSFVEIETKLTKLLFFVRERVAAVALFQGVFDKA